MRMNWHGRHKPDSNVFYPLNFTVITSEMSITCIEREAEIVSNFICLSKQGLVFISKML